jgi:hypothetical protein
MKTYTSDVVFTPAVKSMQTRLGSRETYRRVEEGRGWSSTITSDLAAFIQRRDSFYMATASADGRPYIQHRGGPPGFLHVLDESTLAFADYSGNRQYISAGNLSENDQVSLFLMDYPNRKRVKIWGRAHVVNNDDALLKEVANEAHGARVERVIVIIIEAWDVNCPQHITPRFTESELEPRHQGLQERIAELEAELETLRSEIG